jgi:hypothetical protein
MYDSDYLSLRLNMQAHRIRKSIRLTSQVIMLLRWGGLECQLTRNSIIKRNPISSFIERRILIERPRASRSNSG